jgi:hypothetical protein
MPILTLEDFVGEAHHQIERFKANHAEVEGRSEDSPGRLVYKSNRQMTFAEWWAVFTQRHVYLDLVRLAEIGEVALKRESAREDARKQ